MQGRARARAPMTRQDAAPLTPPFPHSITHMHSTYVKLEAEGEEGIRPTGHPSSRTERRRVDECGRSAPFRSTRV